MTELHDIPAPLRAQLDLTQGQLAAPLGVVFATVNRWEGGAAKPQKAAREAIAALAAEAGLDVEAVAAEPVDAACSIRGAQEAAKFKDYLLPLLFLKRLPDVFDDEIERLGQEYGDHALALEIVEDGHELLRFYLPPAASWGVINGRQEYDWPSDSQGRDTRPRDFGDPLTRAVRAVARQNPSPSGVIDQVDFASDDTSQFLNHALLSCAPTTAAMPSLTRWPSFDKPFC